MMRRAGGGRIRTVQREERRMGPGPGVGGGRRPASFGLPQKTQQPDYFSQFNAWQDPNIGGQQPGPLSQGYGGFAGLGDTMMKTKLNGWLNTFTDPGQRAQAMNGIGYFNQGNPYTPQVDRGVNRGYRAQARGNQQSGDYSAPGTYLHQSSYAPNADGTPNMQFGGYTGFTTVGDNGEAQYSPFDINARGGRTRRTRTFGQVMY